MRILDRDNIKVSLRDMGFSDDNWKRFQALIKRPNGILLVTGPTGSGKTTTLYAALNELNRPDVKIITAEDPVEYYLPGVNQCEVRSKIGMTFARIIRAMLRQNPNILLVGRDPRRRDGKHGDPGIADGTPGFQYAPHERCAQRCNKAGRHRGATVPRRQLGHGDHGPALVRKICPKCKARYEPAAHILKSIGLRPEIAKKANFMKGKGCSHCNKSGYRGRMGIHELMVMTSHPRHDVQGGAHATSSVKPPGNRGCTLCSRTG